MPVRTDVKLTTLGYVIVYVKDIERALSFYRDMLGMTVKMNESGWVEFDTGATTFALHADSNLSEKRGAGQPIPVFNVADIHHVYETLKNAGLKFENAPRQVCEIGPNQIGMTADFHDPDGNFLSIFGVVSK
jgi:lactoylglutathione lyase